MKTNLALPIIPTTPAGRMECMLDLYAPKDEDGIRQPGDGMISLAEFERLMSYAGSDSGGSTSIG